MRLVIISILLSLGVFAQAQNRKNEIKTGTPGAYFFDKSPFRLHDFRDVPLPTHFAYLRKVSNIFYLEFEYSYFWLAGEKGENYFGRIYKRVFHNIGASINSIVFNKKKAEISLDAGVDYRFKGGELYHVRFNYINGIPWEEILDSRIYNEFGISCGIQIKYNFYKRFNVGIKAGLARYFTDVSPNQLSTAFFLGYQF